MTEPIYRLSTPADLPALMTLYPRAFPDEDLRDLVGTLLSGDHDVLSLVADTGQVIVGHILFTRCGLTKDARDLALLAPLCAAPDRQRQGIGTGLIHTGLDRLAADGVHHVYVLGDPGYYGRLGFQAESSTKPPYDLPPEYAGAWQSVALGASATAPSGVLHLPAPWMDPAMW